MKEYDNEKPDQLNKTIIPCQEQKNKNKSQIIVKYKNPATSVKDKTKNDALNRFYGALQEKVDNVNEYILPDNISINVENNMKDSKTEIISIENITSADEIQLFIEALEQDENVEYVQSAYAFGAFAVSSTSYAGNSYSYNPLADNGHVYPSAPLSIYQGINENISLNTGSLIYEDNALHIPGRNGLDLDLTLCYHSNESNVITDASDNYNNVRSGMIIANGWSYKFPRIFCSGNGRDQYLRLADGSTYKMLQGEFSYSYKLQNHNTKDILLEKDYSGNFEGAYYCLSHISGRKDYLDISGCIIGIMDKYGNKITFTHDVYTSYDDSSRRFSGETIIVDTLGNRISIMTNLGFNNDHRIEIYRYVTSATKVKVAEYTMECPFNVDKQRYYILTQKTDQLGRVTRFDYTGVRCYSDPTERSFNSYISGNWDYPSDYDETGRNSSYYTTYQNLTSVTYHNNAQVIYGYEQTLGTLNFYGQTQYCRIIKRNNKADNEEYNTATYQYINNYTGFLSEDAVDVDNLLPSFTYSTIVSELNGISKMYIFNNKHLNTTADTKDNNVLKYRTTYTYDTKNRPSKITNITYGSSGTSITAIEQYEYDDFGNVTAYYSPLAEGNKDNNYKTVYAYVTSPLLTYNMLTSKIYKKDVGTEIMLSDTIKLYNNVE